MTTFLNCFPPSSFCAQLAKKAYFGKRLCATMLTSLWYRSKSANWNRMAIWVKMRLSSSKTITEAVKNEQSAKNLRCWPSRHGRVGYRSYFVISWPYQYRHSHPRRRSSLLPPYRSWNPSRRPHESQRKAWMDPNNILRQTSSRNGPRRPEVCRKRRTRKASRLQSYGLSRISTVLLAPAWANNR